METVLNPNENFLRLKRLTRKARANSRHEVVVQFSLRRTHTPTDDRLDKWSCVWRARNVNDSIKIVLTNSTSASLTFLITSNSARDSELPPTEPPLSKSQKKIVERTDRFRGNNFRNFPHLIYVFAENLQLLSLLETLTNAFHIRCVVESRYFRLKTKLSDGFRGVNNKSWINFARGRRVG